ncbi:SLA class II histocompatibility antigen, DQ haplotype C beta chain-like isoform X2 [Hemiscyllium ocellatum]|uniref:SLA class II histocompatibility antigen, DQ haplotype C beta chain-like isoform X2 n=1 Tax=Hemiscyllium ocellatum TaxID=170820 RepID=UPI002966A76F|nr:SLA class II histocompatibility antigen, DQ haplotype C beta chain-like isoform X2 [Hemiscyllium ocellatum]
MLPSVSLTWRKLSLEMLGPYKWALLAAVASVLDRVGSSTDLHILHVHCDCIYQGQEPVISWEDAYDGDTIMYFNLTRKAFVATQPFAQGLADGRNANQDFVRSVPQQIGSLCEKIKETATLTHFSQQEIAPTSVRAFIEERQGQRVLLCEVRNFAPAEVKVSWVRDGAVITDGRETVSVVPQRNQMFQARSHLTLSGQVDGSYFCQVEHQALNGKLLVPLEHAWTITSETALTIIGAVLGLLGLSFALVTTILYCHLFHPKFTKREGTLCRSNLCNSSIRSDSSASSNTSTTSADDLTKTHA